jgi:hypothetical protein
MSFSDPPAAMPAGEIVAGGAKELRAAVEQAGYGLPRQPELSLASRDARLRLGRRDRRWLLVFSLR